MTLDLTAVIEFDPETGMYVGSVPQIPGAFTQGETLEELRANLREVVELLIEDAQANGEDLGIGQFVGTEKLTVSV